MKYLRLIIAEKQDVDKFSYMNLPYNATIADLHNALKSNYNIEEKLAIENEQLLRDTPELMVYLYNVSGVEFNIYFNTKHGIREGEI